METILVHPENSEQLKALKAFMKALKIKFETKTEERADYNPKFVEQILDGQKEIEEGKGIKIALADLWK